MEGPKPTDSSLQEFYEATAAPIRAYILSHCSDKGSVDDLFQITYVKFLGSRMAGTPDAPEARAYLYRIASNVIADHGRFLQRRNRFEDSEREPAAATTGTHLEDNLALRDALRFLSRRERQLLWLLYAEGFSHKEAATIMSVSSRSVRVLAFRARRRIAALMDQSGTDEQDGQP